MNTHAPLQKIAAAPSPAPAQSAGPTLSPDADQTSANLDRAARIGHRLAATAPAAATGRSLPKATQRKTEASFGHSFAEVRGHGAGGAVQRKVEVGGGGVIQCQTSEKDARQQMIRAGLLAPDVADEESDSDDDESEEASDHGGSEEESDGGSEEESDGGSEEDEEEEKKGGGGGQANVLDRAHDRLRSAAQKASKKDNSGHGKHKKISSGNSKNRHESGQHRQTVHRKAKETSVEGLLQEFIEAGGTKQHLTERGTHKLLTKSGVTWNKFFKKK